MFHGEIDEKPTPAVFARDKAHSIPIIAVSYFITKHALRARHRARLIKLTDIVADRTNHLTRGLTSGVIVAGTDLYPTAGCLLRRDFVKRLTVVTDGFAEI